MWFAAMSFRYEYLQHPWFIILVEKLLRNDPATLKLLRNNPFPNGPRTIRARLYRYRLASAVERHSTGQWWIRSLTAEYLPPVSLHGGGQRDSARRPL
jgi:hypothetical protein